MTDALVIPDQAIKYILFQRTAYLRFPVAPVYRFFNQLLSFPTPLYNMVVEIESRIGKERVKALYTSDMKNEYASLRNFLPQRCSNVLDIGCGVAGIDVFIQRHYAQQQVKFYLLDRSQVTSNIFYLYQPHAAFYNSLNVAKALLVANGIPPSTVQLIEASDTYAIPLDTTIDLVVSLLAWGFHFPVQAYLRQVYKLLREGGVLILDVRKNTDGLALLRRTFQQVETILETAKYDRVAARKEV